MSAMMRAIKTAKLFSRHAKIQEAQARKNDERRGTPAAISCVKLMATTSAGRRKKAVNGQTTFSVVNRLTLAYNLKAAFDIAASEITYRANRPLSVLARHLTRREDRQLLGVARKLVNVLIDEGFRMPSGVRKPSHAGTRGPQSEVYGDFALKVMSVVA